MKLLTLLLFTFALNSKTYSQSSNCDDLKKQNQVLIDKLKQYGIDVNDTETKVNSYSSYITVNFLKCVGDSKNQTVTIYFNMINPELTNQTFYLNCVNQDKNYRNINTQAFDEIGNGFSAVSAILGTTHSDRFDNEYTYLTTQLSTGNFPVQGSVTFANVLPSVKMLRKVILCMNNKSVNGKDEGNKNRGETEINNIKISWR
jgi:hypothetical protein